MHEASSGSPLFAPAILRLVALGEPLGGAIRQYKGAESEEVRRFAFERELGELGDVPLRLLFAAIHLKECSIGDLVEAIHSNRTAVRDGIGELRNYHLMSLDPAPGGFARDEPLLSVPSEIAVMADLVRRRSPTPA